MSSNLDTRNPNLDVCSPLSTGHSGHEGWRSNLGRSPAPEWPRSEAWYTGRSPRDPHFPGRTPEGWVRALTPPSLKTCTREQVQDYFDNTWTQTEILFAALQGEEPFYRPPYHNLRHPLVFYYTHPAALYVNKLCVAGVFESPLNPYFEQLFETGVDEMSWDDLSKNEMDWPSLDQCHAYRKAVYERVKNLIWSHPDLANGHAPITPESPLWALFLGFEHERIHIETTSVLMRELPVSLLKRPQEFPPLHKSAQAFQKERPTFHPPARGKDFPSNPLLPVSAGVAHVGKPWLYPSFGWDNEYGQKKVEVQKFASNEFMITNGEFWEFVVAGGYRDEKWWTKTGWQWRNFRNVKWPTFWVPCGPQGSHQYALRAIFELIEMPWDWPVNVNFHEAEAYANWKSTQENRKLPLRLLSEAEHTRLRQESLGLPVDALSAESDLTAIESHPDINLHLRVGSESPVTVGQSRFKDVNGNLWHWALDHFHPLEGFKIHPYYDDFSTPCYDGKHQMILGGSFISTGDEASVFARFHFRPHFYQHAGFRLVDPLTEGNVGGAVFLKDSHDIEAFEESQVLEQINRTQFAWPTDLMPPGVRLLTHREAILEAILTHTSAASRKKALDVGAATGGLSFALAKHFQQVVAADINAVYVAEGKRIAQSGQVQVSLGEHEARCVEIPLKESARVEFRQTDALCLPAEWLGFDVVVCSNILSRLVSPKSLLGRMGGGRGMVAPGGILVIADSWDWSHSAAPPEVRLQGGAEELLGALGAEQFECLHSFEALSFERPLARRFVQEQVQVTIWRRK